MKTPISLSILTVTLSVIPFASAQLPSTDDADASLRAACIKTLHIDEYLASIGTYPTRIQACVDAYKKSQEEQGRIQRKYRQFSTSTQEHEDTSRYRERIKSTEHIAQHRQIGTKMIKPSKRSIIQQGEALRIDTKQLNQQRTFYLQKALDLCKSINNSYNRNTCVQESMQKLLQEKPLQ